MSVECVVIEIKTDVENVARTRDAFSVNSSNVSSNLKVGFHEFTIA